MLIRHPPRERFFFIWFNHHCYYHISLFLCLVLHFSFQSEIRWRDFKFIDVFSDNCIANSWGGESILISILVILYYYIQFLRLINNHMYVHITLYHSITKINKSQYNYVHRTPKNCFGQNDLPLLFRYWMFYYNFKWFYMCK